jgi:hypothetical protein
MRALERCPARLFGTSIVAAYIRDENTGKSHLPKVSCS